MRTGAAISHTPNPRPGISEAMQHSESSVHPAKDTPLWDKGCEVTTCTTVGGWTAGCTGIKGGLAGCKIVDSGCQSLLPSTHARSVSFMLPLDRCVLNSDSEKGPSCCPSLCRYMFMGLEIRRISAESTYQFNQVRVSRAFASGAPAAGSLGI
jgi:hypothetical protein